MQDLTESYRHGFSGASLALSARRTEESWAPTSIRIDGAKAYLEQRRRIPRWGLSLLVYPTRRRIAVTVGPWSKWWQF